MKLNFVLSWISSKFFVKMIETKGFKNQILVSRLNQRFYQTQQNLKLKLKPKVFVEIKNWTIHDHWKKNKGCVTLWPCPPFILKKHLMAKEELQKFKYSTMQRYNLQKKNPLKETKILQDIIITL